MIKVALSITAWIGHSVSIFRPRPSYSSYIQFIFLFPYVMLTVVLPWIIAGFSGIEWSIYLVSSDTIAMSEFYSLLRIIIRRVIPNQLQQLLLINMCLERYYQICVFIWRSALRSFRSSLTSTLIDAPRCSGLGSQISGSSNRVQSQITRHFHFTWGLFRPLRFKC